LPPPPKQAIPSTRPVAHASNEIRYSTVARRKSIEGVVVLELEVSETGTVRVLRIVSGAPELVAMVMKWVPTWRFKPATKDGKAIRWRTTETIRFRLQDD
jgi:TonB family protein